MATHPSPLIVPVLVITEVAYLIGTRLGTNAEVRFLADLAAGEFTIEAVMASDWLRIAELVSRCRDLPLGPSMVLSWQRLSDSGSPRLQLLIAGTSHSFVPPTPMHSNSFREI